jgi:hypothetical protein
MRGYFLTARGGQDRRAAPAPPFPGGRRSPHSRRPQLRAGRRPVTAWVLRPRIVAGPAVEVAGIPRFARQDLLAAVRARREPGGDQRPLLAAQVLVTAVVQLPLGRTARARPARDRAVAVLDALRLERARTPQACARHRHRGLKPSGRDMSMAGCPLDVGTPPDPRPPGVGVFAQRSSGVRPRCLCKKRVWIVCKPLRSGRSG